MFYLFYYYLGITILTKSEYTSVIYSSSYEAGCQKQRQCHCQNKFGRIDNESKDYPRGLNNRIYPS